MRVLIATDTFLPSASGIVRACLNLGTALTAAGHDVLAVVPRPSRVERARVERVPFRVVEMPSRVFRPVGRRPVVSRWTARRELARVLADWDPEIVHVHSPWAIGQAALTEASRRDIPTVLTVHLTRPNAVNHTVLASVLPGLTWSTVRRSYVTCGKHSNAVTAPSFFGRIHALSLLGRRPVDVVSNGVTELRRAGHPRGVRDTTRLLYVGRLSKEKNVATLIRAVASAELRDKALLDIVGAGTQSRRLRRLARSLDAPVSFVGPLPDEALTARYESADIFCMPSIAELECIAALEAASFGLPIVAPRGSALDEMEGAVCMYDDVDCAQELAGTLSRLIVDPVHQRELKEGARRIAQERSLSNIAREWVGIYERLGVAGGLAGSLTPDFAPGEHVAAGSALG